MRIVNSDRAPAIMRGDVPSLDAVFPTYLIQAGGNAGKVPRARQDMLRTSKSGQICNQTSALSRHPVDHRGPEVAAGGNAVEEQHGVAGTALANIHQVVASRVPIMRQTALRTTPAHRNSFSVKPNSRLARIPSGRILE